MRDYCICYPRLFPTSSKISPSISNVGLSIEFDVRGCRIVRAWEIETHVTVSSNPPLHRRHYLKFNLPCIYYSILSIWARIWNGQHWPHCSVQDSKEPCCFFLVNLECEIFNLFRWFQKHWKKEYFPDRFDVTELFFACYQYMNTTNKVESANIWILSKVMKSTWLVVFIYW